MRRSLARSAAGERCYLRRVSEPSLGSSLLVAMPQLADPNFHRSVVQLVHYDEEGAFGLVINRRAGVAAGDLCDHLEIPWHGDRRAEVGAGGPVQPETGWVLFGGAHDVPDSHRVADNVHFGGSLDGLRVLGETPPERVRLFLGYAGWSAGQLEVELAQGAWLVVPTTADVVFDGREDEVWSRVLDELGIDPASLVPTPGVH